MDLITALLCAIAGAAIVGPLAYERGQNNEREDWAKLWIWSERPDDAEATR